MRTTFSPVPLPPLPGTAEGPYVEIDWSGHRPDVRPARRTPTSPQATAEQAECHYACVDHAMTREVRVGGSAPLVEAFRERVKTAVQTFAKSHRFDLRAGIICTPHYGSCGAVKDLTRFVDGFDFEKHATLLWSDVSNRSPRAPRQTLVEHCDMIVAGLVMKAVTGLNESEKQVFQRHALRGGYLDAAIEDSEDRLARRAHDGVADVRVALLRAMRRSAQEVRRPAP